MATRAVKTARRAQARANGTQFTKRDRRTRNREVSRPGHPTQFAAKPQSTPELALAARPAPAPVPAAPSPATMAAQVNKIQVAKQEKLQRTIDFMEAATTRRNIVPAGLEAQTRSIQAIAGRYPELDVFTIHGDTVVDVDPAESPATLGAYQQLVAVGY